MEMFTIGGYGHSEISFFDALRKNRVDLFIDIRQRRGMRGSKYSFLNATKLQQKLGEIGVAYIFLKELAPSTEVRKVQHNADELSRQTKSGRVALSDEFIVTYKSDVLDRLSIDQLIDKVRGFERICFFCVESGHRACHRSIVSDWLETTLGKAKHI